MKVEAQYEVLGWHKKKATRPGRDDRRLLTLVKPHAKLLVLLLTNHFSPITLAEAIRC
jgi:hypothetical protein